MKEDIVFKPIGMIHSPHIETSKTPIQPLFCNGMKGQIEVYEDFLVGMEGLQGFSHIYVFFYFNQSHHTKLHVKPYLDSQKTGVFSTRAPHRPNKLGMSILPLEKVEGNILYVSNIDILDQTPLIDIKPYIKEFDHVSESHSGWFEDINKKDAKIRGQRDYKKI